MTILKCGLIQMRCEKGATADNIASHTAYYREAVARGVDIVAFPEMSITGYVDPTLQPEAVLRLDGPEIAQVVALTRNRDTTLLAGLVEANPAGKPFITHIVARGGELVGCYRKITIENEEVRWFAPGRDPFTFTHRGLTCGLAVCADIGNREVFAACAGQGARIIFEVAAPGLYGEQATRDWASGFHWWRGECRQHLAGYAREFGVWIAVATQAGRTIDEDFPGGGYVFDPDGRCVYETPDWSPGAAWVELDLS
jgi:predicted amidohydrolase